MSDESQDMQNWLRDLTVRSTAEQLRSLQRYTDLIQRVSRGELNDQEVREEYMRFAGEETARYIRNLSNLSISYYSALIELNRSFNDRFFNRVMQRTTPEASNGHQAPQQINVNLRGKLGTEIVSSFVIENDRIEATEITFAVAEFTDKDQTASFRPPLQIKPPHFILQPKEEREVKIVLPLLPQIFEAGKTYNSSIVVRGYDDLELLLEVIVEAVEAPPKPQIKVRAAKPKATSSTQKKGPAPSEKKVTRRKRTKPS